MASCSVQVNQPNQVESAWISIKQTLLSGLQKGPAVVTLTRPKRTLDQNRLMWPLLKDFSQQVEHFGQKYTQDEWKDLLTAAFNGCTKYAPNLDGTGVVAFGVRTSKWPKDTFSAFIEFMYSEGAQRGVKWSKQSEDSYSEVKK